YYFDSASKTLYGPKDSGAWPAGVALAGADGATGATCATGATGATGAAGTQFLAGASAPTAATGAEGDFYFDTNTSTFYGPKAATAPEWSANVFPIGTAHAAKTYYLTAGLTDVTETLKNVGQTVTVSFPHSGP